MALSKISLLGWEGPKLASVQAFSHYQGTRATQLLTGKAKARTQACLSLLFGVLSHAGYCLPFMGFLDSSCWQSRFLSKSDIRLMHFFELLFILSSAFSRQNKICSNCYQVFTGSPPIFQVCLFFFFNVNPVISLACIKSKILFQGLFQRS